MDDPKTIRSAIFEVIENQMRDGTPPETKETYDRLLSEGYSKEETMKYIACVVSLEIFGVLKEKRTYNNDSYVNSLKALPALPWENDNST